MTLLLLLMPLMAIQEVREPEVHVELLHLVPATRLEIVAIEPAEILVDSAGSQPLAQNERIRFSHSTGDPFNTWPDAEQITVTGRVLVQVVAPHNFERRVHGRLMLSRGPEFIRDMLAIPLEQAVAEITAAEAGRDVPEAALAALSVCVRSYLMSRSQRGRISVDGTTRTMLYRGIDGAFGSQGALALREAEEAVQATMGVVLTSAGQVVPGYFHARCGGRTDTIADTFTLQSGETQGPAATCPPCEQLAESWEWKMDAAAFQQLFQSLDAHDVTLQRTDSGAIVVPGGKPELYSAEGFRLKICRKYGWNSLRGTDWRVKHAGNHLLFVGRRHGHGIGLCMYGAFELARGHEVWEDILKRYFPGTTLMLLDSVASP